MTYGFTGTILRVNLTTEKIGFEHPPDAFYRRYVGGRGIIAYYLLKELNPGIDPFSPENKLIFACGPVTGAPISGSGRNSVGAKSPLTGTYGEAEAGGFWGAALKHAGFDAIIVDGKAAHPLYLHIEEGQAKLRDAAHVWGLEIKQAQETIRQELDDPSMKIAQIGPGGEKLVRYAAVVNDLNHVAGRCGMGAVMGSKHLKAIAVRGTGRMHIADADQLRTLARWMAQNVDKVAHGLHTYGTGAIMDVYEATGNLPIHNFREGRFPDVDAISARAVKDTVLAGMGTCFACAVRCKKEVQVDAPWQVDPAYGGPEYETLAALGSNCGVADLKAVCKANELCQRYGLDTISTGVAIGFAMECVETGCLRPDEVDGLDLRFGNAAAMVRLVQMIGERRGIGDVLAEGVKRAAARFAKGAAQLAVHVKGQEVPMHEPRLKMGLGLGYAMSPTGADHVHNIHDTLYEKAIPKTDRGLGLIEGVPAGDLSPRKVRLFKTLMLWRSLNNCLVMCLFTPWTVQQKVAIVRAVTGWDTSAVELIHVSERALTLARLFNVREGFTADDDWLPPRFLTPKTSGALSDTAVNPHQLKRAKAVYYRMMGWTEEGVPTAAKLDELDIAWAAAARAQNVSR